MEFEFYKYQGAGNDFIIIDNRKGFFPKSKSKLISQLCDRKFGIGADGLLLLESHATANFSMVYFNADGKLGSMCGNGGRCIVHFANLLGIIKEKTVFEAVDGLHEATLSVNIVSLKMMDVRGITVHEDHVFLDTGSPHHVQIVSDLENFNVKEEGAKIRFNRYGEEGANINFVASDVENRFAIRTYERGVEDETLSCGTGVTAVALALFETGIIKLNEVALITKGGLLIVEFKKMTSGGYTDIFLKGPATKVFKGNWNE